MSPDSSVLLDVVDWYRHSGRDLPWRRAGTSPWAVFVSEVMLQQTPVARVIPAYEAWLHRWPTPAVLAAASAGEAVRQWGRLGYPRRALNLHAAAVAMCERHEGAVPPSVDDLLALPGVGPYTARAVAAFAFGQRQPVVDTNVRRAIARWANAQAGASSLSLDAVAELLPTRPALAAEMSAALMELGAMVCTARTPRCDACPLAASCLWRSAGYPANGPAARRQLYDGTDRQVRGRLLALLREAPEPLPIGELETAWPEPVQRERALEALLTDGLARRLPDGRVALPG